MMSKIFCAISILVALSVFAADDNPYADIAQEMYEQGEYSKAIEKCKSVLAQQKDNKQCLDVTQKSEVALANKKKDKEQKQIAADKAAKKAELKAEEGRKKAAADEAAAERREQEKLNSPAYNSEKVCHCIAGKKFLMKKIDEEKKAGSIGGFVDKGKLHKYSSQIIMIEKAENYYRGKAKSGGGSSPEGSCGNTKQDWDSFARCVDGTPNEAFN